MNYKGNSPNIGVESIINRVWEWANQYLAKILICEVVNLSVLLNVVKKRVKCIEKVIAESAISLLVIPQSRFFNVLQHRW